MPTTIAEGLQASTRLAAAKARDGGATPRYLASSAMAGLFVGVAVVLLLTTAGPMGAAGSPATKLVSGAVFGIALTLVVFAGGELFTGNVMYMAHGLSGRTVRTRDLGVVWLTSLVGNAVGSVILAAMVNASGSLTAGATPGQPGPAMAFLGSMIDGKVAATGGQLFWRAVLCNMLVCLALWMAVRAHSDSARILVLAWPLLAFIAAGFEHSVANMTIFALAAFADLTGWQDVWRNLLWTISGNVVGGGVLVGLSYAWIGSAGPGGQPEEHDMPRPARAQIAARLASQHAVRTQLTGPDSGIPS